jgi:hypothetical protein
VANLLFYLLLTYYLCIYIYLYVCIYIYTVGIYVYMRQDCLFSLNQELSHALEWPGPNGLFKADLIKGEMPLWNLHNWFQFFRKPVFSVRSDSCFV